MTEDLIFKIFLAFVIIGTLWRWAKKLLITYFEIKQIPAWTERFKKEHGIDDGNKDKY